MGMIMVVYPLARVQVEVNGGSYFKNIAIVNVISVWELGNFRVMGHDLSFTATLTVC